MLFDSNKNIEPTVRFLFSWSDWLTTIEPFSILYLNQIKLGWSRKRRPVPSMIRIKKFTTGALRASAPIFLLESNKFMLPALRRFHWLCWVSWWLGGSRDSSDECLFDSNKIHSVSERGLLGNWTQIPAEAISSLLLNRVRFFIWIK